MYAYAFSLSVDRPGCGVIDLEGFHIVPNGRLVPRSLSSPQFTPLASGLTCHSKQFSRVNLNYADLTYGDSTVGSQRLLRSLSNLFNNYFEPILKVAPEHIVTGVGVSAIIDQLSEKLCDVGEGILIAAPYYSKYLNLNKLRIFVLRRIVRSWV